VADLTTVAAVKQWLGIKEATTDDTLLASLVSGVSRWIQKWLSRTIATAILRRDAERQREGCSLPGQHSDHRGLERRRQRRGDPGAHVGPGSGYTFDEDAIYLVGYCFTKGVQNVQLGYTAGFASTPEDLELATKKLVGMSYREKDRIGQSSKGLQGEQTNFIVKDLPADVELILDRYKRVVPVTV
jgi:hypothetical protein